MTTADYLRVLTRHKGIVVFVVLLAVAAAVAYSWRQAPLYEATARVALNSQPTLPGVFEPTVNNNAAAQRFAETQATLARNEEVALAALRGVRGARMEPRELLQASDVTPSSGADVLVFRVRDGVADRAAALATSYAKAFVEHRSRIAIQGAQERIRQLREELPELLDELRAATGEEVRALTQRYTEAAQDLDQLNTYVAFSDQNAVVADEAERARQIQPRMERNIAIAGVLGLVAGIILAFLYEALTSRVRSPDEVASQLELPVLGRIPRPPRALARAERLVMLADPTSPEAESFRMLRARIQLANPEGKRRILVTSATSGEGKSTTTANLAVAFAEAGQRVVLVDLDLHNPTLHRFFDLDVAPGIANVVRGEVDLDDALRTVAVAPGTRDAVVDRRSAVLAGTLSVLTMGRSAVDPGPLLLSSEMGRVLGELGRRADVVLIDTAPLLLVSHALVLASRVDAVLAIARAEALTRELLTGLHEAIAALPVTKLGVVLTDEESPVAYGYHNQGAAPAPIAVNGSGYPVIEPTRGGTRTP